MLVGVRGYVDRFCHSRRSACRRLGLAFPHVPPVFAYLLSLSSRVCLEKDSPAIGEFSYTGANARVANLARGHRICTPRRAQCACLTLAE